MELNDDRHANTLKVPPSNSTLLDSSYLQKVLKGLPMRMGQLTMFSDIMEHKLPTNTLSKSMRIQRWGNFIAGFSIEFVERCLADVVTAQDEAIVLDPFAGCGTTLVAAKNLGFRAIGYELNPVFHAISCGKVQHYKTDDSILIASHLARQREPLPWSEDAKKYLAKLFTAENLTAIQYASHNVTTAPTHLKPLSVTMFLKACEKACGSQTDGIYKAPTSTKKHIPFQQALEWAAQEFEDDIRSQWYSEHWISTPNAKAHLRSSQDLSNLKPGSVISCITSPPYLNNFDYGEMTRMHLYLLGWCRDWKHISDSIRNHLITNTTTALKGKKAREYQGSARQSLPPSLLPEIDDIVSNLACERSTRAGKKEYDYLVYPYYSQIARVLSGVLESLKPGARVHWVVADAALYGIHIETHKHTARIMEEIGFKDVKINFLRKRGHRWLLSKRDGAKAGLGEYHIEGRK